MEDKKLLTIRALSSDKGIKLYFQSDIFEEFFAVNHQSQGYGNAELAGAFTWGDVLGYQPPPEKAFNRFRHWGGQLYYKGRPNLSFLCAKGLTNGVTFNLTSLVVNENILEKYVRDLKRELAKIYREYFNNISYEESFSLED